VATSPSAQIAGQGFAFIRGELVSYGSLISPCCITSAGVSNFHLQLQFKVFDPNNCNSGVFIRFRNPLERMPAVLRARADAEGGCRGYEPRVERVFLRLRVQIDDNAAATLRRTTTRRPEPDGLWKIVPALSTKSPPAT